MGVWSFLFNLDIHNIHKIKLCLLQISEEVLSVEDDLWLLLFPHVGSMHLLIQTALRLPQLRASSSSQAVVTHTSRTCLINTWAPCLRVVSSAVTRSAWPSSAPKTLPPALTAAITCPASRGCRQTASTSTHSRANTLPTTSTSRFRFRHPHTTLWATTLKAPSLPGPISGANAGAWSSGRPSPQYLNHPHHSKPGSSLGWFRTISSPASSSSPSAVNSRFHSSPSLLDPQRQPLLQDKSKESGEDTWMEAPSVKSVDSADSGLFEGGESKKKRVSPYTSSTENSPPNRSAEACEKDNCSDAGYYGFYTHWRPALRLYSCCLPPTICLHDPKRRDRALRDSS